MLQQLWPGYVRENAGQSLLSEGEVMLRPGDLKHVHLKAMDSRLGAAVFLLPSYGSLYIFNTSGSDSADTGSIVGIQIFHTHNVSLEFLFESYFIGLVCICK